MEEESHATPKPAPDANRAISWSIRTTMGKSWTSTRHSCGSWLALQGVHPNIIKTVMRHGTITLTMDTYGHLLPDQHAEAIGGMVMMTKTPLAATGTAGGAPAVETAVGNARASDRRRSCAKRCERAENGDGAQVLADCGRMRSGARASQWPRRDSNPHGGCPPGDFKSPVSTSSTTQPRLGLLLPPSPGSQAIRLTGC